MKEITPESNPFEVFANWFDEAKNSDIQEPTAMTLATANKNAAPSARIVLLKHFDERGFVFYTNSRSRKGEELLSNPQAAICFYWMPLNKQIRIEGKIEQVKGSEADEYFASRHPVSRYGAWASLQSQELEDRQILIDRVDEMKKKYGENPPRPMHWYGFRVVPKSIEFWEDGDFRLHERNLFEKNGNGWAHKKLYP